MRKLSMWRRLGIVVSIVWIMAGGFWQRTYDVHKASEFSAVSYTLCTETSAQRGDFDFKPCSEKAERDFDLMMEGSWGMAAFFAFAPVLVGWLLAWITFRVGRWVLAGRENA